MHELRSALKPYSAQISSMAPLGPDYEEYSPENWKLWFEAKAQLTHQVVHPDSDVCLAIDHFINGELTRNGILDFADSATLKSLLAACFMWGYGLAGRGTLNLHAALSDKRVDKVLATAAAGLEAGDIVAAHLAFCPAGGPALAGCGEAFLTKFCYFYSASSKSRDSRFSGPTPLIFDDRVKRSLSSLLGSRWRRTFASLSSADDTAGLYQGYCIALNDMTDWRPDQVEMFLFKNKGVFPAEGQPAKAA